ERLADADVPGTAALSSSLDGFGEGHRREDQLPSRAEGLQPRAPSALAAVPLGLSDEAPAVRGRRLHAARRLHVVRGETRGASGARRRGRVSAPRTDGAIAEIFETAGAAGTGWRLCPRFLDPRRRFAARRRVRWRTATRLSRRKTRAACSSSMPTTGAAGAARPTRRASVSSAAGSRR